MWLLCKIEETVWSEKANLIKIDKSKNQFYKFSDDPHQFNCLGDTKISHKFHHNLFSCQSSVGCLEYGGKD